MELWNDKSLGFPPVNTYKATNKNIDLQRLYSYIMETKEFFHAEQFMYPEYLLLSRIIYRMRLKFRPFKQMNALLKLLKALKIYFQLGLAKDLEFYSGLIPPRYQIAETYLPNKNLLDYILLRLQGVVKLMERIVETSKVAASFLNDQLSLGHFWKVTLIMFAIASRIHVIAKYVARGSCEHYRKLYPFSQQMKNNGASILPDGYEMCKDLRQWLDADWLDLDDDIQILEEPPEMSIIKYFNLAADFDDDDDQEVLVSNEYVLVEDPDPEEVEIINSFKQLPRINLKRKFDEVNRELRGFEHEDVGEVIKVADETITSLFDQSGSTINHSVDVGDLITDGEDSADQKSVSSNRKRKFNTMNSPTGKGRKGQSPKKLKIIKQTNEVIEVDSLSDSSVVIVDEVKKNKKLKKRNKQAASNPNTSIQNTKAKRKLGGKTTAKGKKMKSNPKKLKKQTVRKTLISKIPKIINVNRRKKGN